MEYQRYQFYEYNTTLEVQALGEALLKMINDTDAILGTNTNYLLGPWLENAKCVWVVVCSSNQPDSTLCAISWFCLTLQELGKHTCRAKPSGVQRPEPNHALG